MTGSDMTHLPHDGDEADARARIARAVARARLNLLWETIWPRIAPLLTLAALFAAVSWLGLWRLTAAPVRWLVLAGFAVAALYFLWRIVRFRRPSQAAAFARVEQATGALHQPATAFTDTLASGRSDPTAEALWLAHRRRLLASLANLRAGTPAPRLDRRDPYALRFLVALVFIVGFLVAGPERMARIGEAFQGGEPTAATIARIDAWVTPPDYTGRAPIFLTGEAARAAGSEYSVPTGSIVTVRTGGAHDLDVVSVDPDASETPLAPGGTTAPARIDVADAAPLEHQMKLTANGSVVVRKDGRDISAWRFAVEPDRAPAIALTGEPGVTASGALHLTYSLDDDYGVVAARGEIAPLDKVAGATGAAGATRPLYEAPPLPLSLPQLRARNATGETTRDLTAHPWAGATVRLTLVATDEAGQEGRSAPVELTLPVRHFVNPVAAALVEQRATLAQDANAAIGVADALDALTMLPDKGLANTVAYLAVRSAYYRLAYARNDDDLRGVVDYLWSIALGLEDGDLSLTAQALRDAQEALRRALERDAPDDEIQRLAQELRDAMDRFMQALAEQAARNPDVARMPIDPNARVVREEDLQRMINRIEELAKTGARDAARQLLSQLQNMMENLQAGQQMMADQTGQQMMESLNQLGDMIRRQEELMNRTFQAQRGQDGDDAMTREELEQALRDLQAGQEELARRLQELTEQMEGMGMQPNGKLGQAGEAMGRAAEALGGQSPGAAVGEQGTALEQLRQGAQGLAQQLANRGQGQGPGQGFRSGSTGLPNEDPLGRAQRNAGPDFGSSVRVPDEIDTQRAREILDAIRRRLGEGGRPAIERDYLERLLDRL